LVALTSILENDLSRLWKAKTEESFHNLFFGVAYKFCENPANLKDASLKDCIHQLLVVALRASKSNVQGVVSSVVDMIMKHEHVTPFFVDFIFLINKNDSQDEEDNSHQAVYSSFVNQIFMEIGSIEDLNSDGAGTKHLSGFICDVSERLPRCILSNMSVLLPHLQSENYTIRNAILHALSRVVAQLPNSNDQVTAKTRDQLLSILEERFRDVNAYTRSKVIQCWSYLCEEKAIPLKTLPVVVELVIGRLMDKSAFVRKSGVQFLMLILQFNPYGGELKLSHFKHSLEKWEKTADEEQQSTERVKQFAYLTEAIRFITQIHESINAASDLLLSKTTSDVTECIQFLCTCYKFGIETSLDGIRKMLKLVWSREQSVKDYVIEQFDDLMISRHKLSNPNKCIEVARDLIRVALVCNRAEQTALETVMILIVQKNKFPKLLLLALWELFGADQSPREDRIGSAIIIAMIACARPEPIRKKIKTLVDVGLASSTDLYLATYTCKVLTNLSIDDSSSLDDTSDKKRKDDDEDRSDVLTYEGGSNNFKLRPDHFLFQRLKELISSCDGQCIPFIDKAYNVIFKLAESPEMLSYQIINSLAVAANLKGIVKKNTDMDQSMEESTEEPVEEEKKCIRVSSTALCKLLFTLGQSIMLECVNVELQFKKAKKHKQLASLQTEQEDNKKGKKKTAKKPAKRGRKKKQDSSDDEEDEELDEESTDKPAVSAIEAELGLDPNSLDDHELEERFELRERNILSDQSIYGAFASLVITLVTQEKTTPELTKSAVLTLCKFMCVNQEFCDKYLQLLFTLLHNSANSDNFGLRSNIIVSIGDLACRFPNSVEPWIHHMYQCLRDNDRQVRKNTLMVLTHLALNDMIKVKSNMVELVKCIEDEDEEIANLSQAFFGELARKSAGGNNPIYNLIPEVLSRLSLEETERSKQGLDDDDKFRESFRNIMKFLLAFVTKDRQVEKLVEKLCQRFSAVINTGDEKLSSSVVRQWRDIAYCLTLLPFNEKCVKKIIDCEKHYQQAIADKEVFDIILNLGTKSSKKEKGTEKGVDKEVLAEWENKITDRHRKLCDDEVIQSAVSEAGTTATKKKTTRGKKKAAPAKGKKGGRRKRKDESEEEEEEEEQDDEDLILDEEDDEEAEKPKKAKATPRRRKATKKVQKEDDEEEEQEEIQAPTPARNTRGRKVTVYKDSEDEEEAEEEEEKPKPARRGGRGRKKIQDEEEYNEEPSDKENDHPNVRQKTQQTPKKKNSKIDLDDDEEDDQEVVKAVKKAVTKGRSKTTTAKGKTSGVRKRKTRV
jgi:condensin complex subunit 1